MLHEFKTSMFQSGISLLTRRPAAIGSNAHDLDKAALGGSAAASLKDAYGGWIEAVARTIASKLSGFASPRVLRLVENENGELEPTESALLTDSSLQSKQLIIVDDLLENRKSPLSETALSRFHVELVLRADRFLMRPLELPTRAAEFLDGIVRAQIDRLTPWNTGEAAYGWSKPVVEENDRITVMVAAVSKEIIVNFLQALTAYGASSVAIFAEAVAPIDETICIKVLEHQSTSRLDAAGIRRALNIALASSAVAASLSVGASTLASSYVHSRQEKIALKLGAARGAITADANSNIALQRALEQRKFDIAPTVMVIEGLSRVLPDDTYVTALQIDGDKVRITGVARNAPALIELLERSTRFARASFFAPTTRSPSESGERFHIEALIQPVTVTSSL